MTEKIRKTINLNDTVKVKLTKSGLMHYVAYMEECAGHGLEVALYPKRDDKGFAEFQLWDLIHIFAKQIFPGAKTPFVNCEIVIDEADKRTTDKGVG